MDSPSTFSKPRYRHSSPIVGSQAQVQPIHAAPAAMSAAATSPSTITTATKTKRKHKSPLDTGCHPIPPSSEHRSRRRHSLNFPPLFHQNTPPTTSTSVVSSTAQGRPIPIDQETTLGRISALREININYPSRHSYSKSTGAQSTTYSQPVIVRTYSGPHSRRPASTTRGGRSSRLKHPFTSVSTQSTSAARNVGPGLLSNSMVRPRHMPLQGNKHRSRSDNQPARLPPVDAFSFKSFLADASMQQDIGTDLDRIAEICARSRYSLSNQYEVHMAPHGSGSAFVAGQPAGRASGPTLQAVPSDDDRNSRKRRNVARRRSVAYGTLETIMSSSRSSEEDRKQNKKSAAEIADEVRGREAHKSVIAAAGGRGDSGPKKFQEATRSGYQTRSHPQDAGDESGQLAKKKSTSFATAIIDSSRHPAASQGSGEPAHEVSTSASSSSAALHSNPALPQTSRSHLEIRTAPEANGDGTPRKPSSQQYPPESPTGSQDARDGDSLPGSDYSFDMAPRGGTASRSTRPCSGWSSWIPWKASGLNSARRRSGAEGSLRELLVRDS